MTEFVYNYRTDRNVTLNLDEGDSIRLRAFIRRASGSGSIPGPVEINVNVPFTVEVSGLREARHVLTHGSGTFSGQLLVERDTDDTTTVILDIEADTGPTYVGPVDLANVVTPDADDLLTIQGALGITSSAAVAGRELDAVTFEIVSDTPDNFDEILHASGNDLSTLVICLRNSHSISSDIHAIVIHEELGGSIQTEKVGEFIVTGHSAQPVGLDFTRITYTGYLSDETKRAFGGDGFALGTVGNDVRLYFLEAEPITAYIAGSGTSNSPLGYGSDGSIGTIDIIPSNVSSDTINEDRVLGFDSDGDFDVSPLVGVDVLYWPNRDADICLLYTSPSPRDRTRSRMPSSA